MKRRRFAEVVAGLTGFGLSVPEILTICRCARTLNRWFEAEAVGRIQYDNDDGRPYLHFTDGQRAGERASPHPIPDRRAGALRRVRLVLRAYPHLSCDICTDPRGAPLTVRRVGGPGVAIW